MAGNGETSARILVVDDHGLIRRGIGGLLAREFDVCGEAENGKEAVRKTLELKPDLVILDLSMPVMNGLEAACEIRRLAPATKILILTMHDSPMMKGALELAGVDGLVLKTAPPEELILEVKRLTHAPDS